MSDEQWAMIGEEWAAMSSAICKNFKKLMPLRLLFSFVSMTIPMPIAFTHPYDAIAAKRDT